MKRKNLLKKFCIITFIVVSALIMYTNGTVYSTIEKLSATDYTGKIPSYYQEIGVLSNGLKVYSFENVRGSSGGYTTLYRVSDGTYLYEASDTDEYKSSPLTAEEIALEKPQPSISGSSTNYTNNVEISVVGPNISLQYNFVGQYLLNYAASSNIYGRLPVNVMGGFIFDERKGRSVPLADTTYGSYVSGTASEGTLNIDTLNMDKSIIGNASKAELTASKNTEGTDLEATNIKTAYLIMETSVDISTNFSSSKIPNAEAIKELQNMGNRPMTLVSPSGATIKSNGYLPADFLIAYDDSYHSADSALNTGSEKLSSDTPTILYSLGAGNKRVRATTITDVTDFVKKEGYGTYYGYHILTKADTVGVIADVACGWKLVVLEEDETMSYSRVGSLQFGMINSNYDNIGTDTLNLDVSLSGYKTPKTEDFNGQLFFSSVGSNPLDKQYLITLDPDGTGVIPSFYLETRDRSGGNINRGFHGSSESFGQNIISIDGQRRTNMSSYRLLNRGNPAQ